MHPASGRSASHLLSIFVLLFSIVSCRPHAPKVADPRSPEEKSWEAAHSLEDEGRVQESMTAYRKACGTTPPYIRACFDYARMMFKTAAPKDARPVATWTVSHFPSEGLTLSLVKQLAQSYVDNGDISAGIQELSSLEIKLQKSEVDDSLLYEIARLHKESKDAAAETKTLTVIVSRYNRWNSQVWDDAVWRLAAICREENLTADEIKWLEKLLHERESSRLIGSYNSPNLDDAMLRLGDIYLSEKRYDDAYRVFIELSKFTTSRMDDDGLMGAARTEIERGNLKNACKLLADAVRKDGSVKKDATSLAASISCSL
jgi:tetratricopeptide (TPR) repeat protein